MNPMRSAECGTRNSRARSIAEATVRTHRHCSAFRVPRSAFLSLLTAAPLVTATAQALPPLPDSNGWGLSTDGGKTWKNWEFRELGPEWQYVAPNGIVTVGDTTYIATADGIKVTGDDGKAWAVITDSAGVATAKDPIFGRIANQYALSLDSSSFRGSSLIVEDLRGCERSVDGGRTWLQMHVADACEGAWPGP